MGNRLRNLFTSPGDTSVTGIFISYRRRGSQGFAGRLADDLIDRFGEERVFRDVEIKPGDDFAETIESAIASCSALLVVLGPQWLDHRNEKGAPRLHEPGDWVRLEIEAALARNTWIVPILVGGAQMPPASALPDSIQRLSRIQAFELTDRRWDRDVEHLAAMMASHIPELDHSGKTEGKNRKIDRDQPVDSPARALRDAGARGNRTSATGISAFTAAVEEDMVFCRFTSGKAGQAGGQHRSSAGRGLFSHPKLRQPRHQTNGQRCHLSDNCPPMKVQLPSALK